MAERSVRQCLAPSAIKNRDDLLGVLSLILIPMSKYVFIVLNADDNGELEKVN